ncbi:efflux transporter outer membrane subunit [Acetobacteraceae bacterium H6797]|nr:efflux transporter outer membrane subunit [Acetobacteraceae bacterium H6797]
MMRLPIGLTFSAMLLSGCSLIPDYSRPAAPVPASFPTGGAYGTPATGERAADAIGWKEFFLDPGMRRAIEIALANNRDLRVSTLQVAEAEATYRVQRGDLFPSIGGTGTVTYQQTPLDLTSAGRVGPSVTSRTWQATLGFTSWELDLFGRVRSLTRSAFESYLQAEETRRAAQITLVSQVADAYLTLLADRELLDLARQTLASREQTYRLTDASVRGGTATTLTLRQAQAQAETARADVAQYTRLVAQDENALALLLGQPLPPDLLTAGDMDAPLMLADVPSGLSSEVLLRRPDVVAAEHGLKSANANIGAARAAFFPSISLTSGIGTSGPALSRLFQPHSGAWSFAPTINIPIFSGGANQANLDLAKVRTNIQVATYEKTVQTAFREVADALAARGTYGDQIKAQEALTAAYADSYRLSEARFRSGVDSYLETLDAQRSLYSAQQSLITLRRERLANLITLYKVLGGGVN